MSEFASIWTYVLLAVFLIIFAVVMLATGVFTAYFGSGKSRQIGGGLTFGGIILLSLTAFLFYLNIIFPGPVGLWDQVLFPMLVILIGATLGAVAAIGLFLFAIMKA
jgi:hypothetical protein